VRPINWICTAAIVAALALGCGKPESQSQPETVKPKAKLRLAFITNNAADFWAIARAGCEKAAAELANVTLEFRIPSDATAAT
jgi:ribose transport system substrate-binding protein